MKKIIFIGILTLVLNGLILGQPAKKEFPYQKIAKLRIQIEELLQKDETKKALQILDETEDQEVRKESDFYVIKAEVFIRQKDFEKANDYFQTAFDFEMLNFFNNYNLCRDAFSSGFKVLYMECGFAIINYKKMAQINIKRQSELEKADAIQYLLPFNLKHSEELKPMFEDILLWRGGFYLKVSKFEKAEELLSLAIKQNPTKYLAHVLRAKAYRGLGKNDLAEADEKKALDLR